MSLIFRTFFTISGLLGLLFSIFASEDVLKKTWIRNKQAANKNIYLEKYNASMLYLSSYVLVLGLICLTFMPSKLIGVLWLPIIIYVWYTQSKFKEYLIKENKN